MKNYKQLKKLENLVDENIRLKESIAREIVKVRDEKGYELEFIAGVFNRDVKEVRKLYNLGKKLEKK